MNKTLPHAMTFTTGIFNVFCLLNSYNEAKGGKVYQKNCEKANFDQPMQFSFSLIVYFDSNYRT